MSFKKQHKLWADFTAIYGKRVRVWGCWHKHLYAQRIIACSCKRITNYVYLLDRTMLLLITSSAQRTNNMTVVHSWARVFTLCEGKAMICKERYITSSCSYNPSLTNFSLKKGLWLQCIVSKVAINMRIKFLLPELTFFFNLMIAGFDIYLKLRANQFWSHNAQDEGLQGKIIKLALTNLTFSFSNTWQNHFVKYKYLC